MTDKERIADQEKEIQSLREELEKQRNELAIQRNYKEECSENAGIFESKLEHAQSRASSMEVELGSCERFRNADAVRELDNQRKWIATYEENKSRIKELEAERDELKHEIDHGDDTEAQNRVVDVMCRKLLSYNGSGKFGGEIVQKVADLVLRGKQLQEGDSRATSVAFGKWLFDNAKPACVYKKEKELWKLNIDNGPPKAAQEIKEYNDLFQTTDQLYTKYQESIKQK